MAVQVLKERNTQCTSNSLKAPLAVMSIQYASGSVGREPVFCVPVPEQLRAASFQIKPVSYGSNLDQPQRM